MLQLFLLTLPIFLLIAVGFFAVRAGWVSESALPSLGSYVIKLALPALLFQSMASRPVEESLNLDYLRAYALGSVLMLVIAFAFSARLRKLSCWESAFQGLGATLANSAFIGLAVAGEIFGSAAAVAVALSMLVDLLLLIPLGLLLAELCTGEAGAGRRALQLLKRTLANPLVLAIAAGLLVSWLEFELPEALEQTVGMLGRSAAAVALFVIGGSLVSSSMQGRAVDISQMAVSKLLLHPAIMALTVWMLPDFDPAMQAITILMAAMPMASVLSLLGARYGQSALCAPALVVATALSFISVNLVLILLGVAGMLPLSF
ncbi:AEC family transporter [Marinobacterium sp. AK62]|uniref:AEC family transporter n=1 Tax=Marinobacterium alkalitolerans TaxID=1542925 RepID=A0ABS3Z876_9GAMM|nr:AEC family transporter [Marinobacterium alkalitolerans]MBP0047918.1 AEC family transporter [Marinobacterium alkalitolerans]